MHDGASKELHDEVRASHDMTVAEAAWSCVSDCIEGWLFEFDGRVACLTGITDINWDTGSPWLLTTPIVSEQRRVFLTMSKVLLERWSHAYTCQVNWIDARYKQSLLWAKHCGFQLFGPEKYGSYGLPFYRCEFRR